MYRLSSSWRMVTKSVSDVFARRDSGQTVQASNMKKGIHFRRIFLHRGYFKSNYEISFAFKKNQILTSNIRFFLRWNFFFFLHKTAYSCQIVSGDVRIHTRFYSFKLRYCQFELSNIWYPTKTPHGTFLKLRQSVVNKETRKQNKKARLDAKYTKKRIIFVSSTSLIQSR